LADCIRLVIPGASWPAAKISARWARWQVTRRPLAVQAGVASAAHPPDGHRPERADDELRRQLDRAVVLPRGALGRHFGAHQVAHHRAEQPLDGHLALALERRSIERACRYRTA